MAQPTPSAPGTVSDPGRPITHRRVLHIALPIVVSNATVPILGAVDTGVVGQMGLAAPIGAVGIGAIIVSGLYWIFGFLRMGTSGLVAQAHGAGDADEVSALLSRALLIGGVAGLAIFALQVPLFALAFKISPASDEVEGLARTYLMIRVWGAPASIAIYAVTGWLIAQERTRAVLLLQLWMNGLNIGLDFLFVLGLGWGVAGVATGTIMAEWTGLALGLWLCRGAFGTIAWRTAARVFDRARLTRMMSVNGDIMIRSMLLQASFMSFLFLGADLGDATLAANQVLVQFLHITAYALDGFAFAAEALVGSAMGARKRAALRRAALLTSLWGIGLAVPMGIVFYLGGTALIDLMATAPEVRAEAGRYLIWIAAAPAIGAASWMLDGIFIGATRTREMRNAMLISVAVYIIALAVLLPAFDNHGLWASLMVLNITRGVTLGLRYPALEAAADPAPTAAARSA